MAVAGGLVLVEVDDLLGEPDRPPARRPIVLFVLLLVAAAMFLAYGWRVIGAPFGDSHDGRNAGVWATSGRALREDGLAASRVGTRSPELGTYANHPPLIAVEVAVAETLGGRSAAATRAPAWLGSVAAIGLLAALLRQRSLRAGAVGVAVLLTVATPMFLVFGTMLDTPVTSLPFGLAVLLVWERARAGRRVPRPLAAGLTMLAVLAGWQSLLVAGAVGAWAVARIAQRRSGDGDAAFVAGAVAGAALLVAWLWWAFGGTVSPLADAYLYRTGHAGRQVPLAELLTGQLGDLGAMFGPVLGVGVLGLVAALGRRSTRGLAAVALAVTLPYPVVFRTGAVNHEYWDYWFLLPLAIGLAAGADWVLGALRDRTRAEVALAGAGCGLAALMGLAALLHPSAAGWAIHEGVRAGAVAERAAAALPPEQVAAWYAGAVGRDASWISLPTRRPAVHVDRGDVVLLAAERPDDLVLVGRMRCRAGAPHIDYGLETAAALAAHPAEVGRC